MLRKLLSALLLFFCASRISAQENFPFKLTMALDGILLGTSAAFAATGYGLCKWGNLPDWDERSRDLDDVNAFDRKFARAYNRSLDRAADITCAVSLAALPAGIYAAEFFSGSMRKDEIGTLFAMYAESLLMCQGIKNSLKFAARRIRPYMYFDGFPSSELDSHDFEFSFPSGHSSDTFMSATFLTYTYFSCRPDSSLKIPVAIAAYSFAAGTAILRVRSGNHFATDVLAGAAIGSAIGFGIPFLHTLAAKKSSAPAAPQKGDVSFTLLPNCAGITVRL